MPAALYAREEDISPRNLSNPSLCAENRLNLLPEHIAQISTAYIKQLSKAHLAPRDSRILSAIYSQTIGYDKREDDMNGTRLHQLTGIRHDHANESVRRLEHFNIILTHKGQYGKWMSINFDFPNWGKALSEATSNDPSCLLSEIYQSPLPLDDEFAEFKLHVPVENRKNEAIIAVKEPAVPVIKEEKSIALSAPKSLEKPKKPTPAPVEILAETPVKAPVETPVKAPAPVVKKPQPAAFTLIFPDSFTDKLRKLISHHLASFKIPEEAQRLLDYFAKCFKNGNIRNPIGYLIGLKKRWLAGKLDLNDYQQTPTSTKTEEEKAQQRRKSEQRFAYQKAVADVEQVKKMITNVSNENDCTFEEALKRVGFTSIWEGSVACLAQTKKACFEPTASTP